MGMVKCSLDLGMYVLTEDFLKASNDILTDHPMVFDAAGFYGHNECEYRHSAINAPMHERRADICNLVDVKAMRINRYQFGRNYMNAYHSHFPISPPEEDLDARLALYSLRRYALETSGYLCLPVP